MDIAQVYQADHWHNKWHTGLCVCVSDLVCLLTITDIDCYLYMSSFWVFVNQISLVHEVSFSSWKVFLSLLERPPHVITIDQTAHSDTQLASPCLGISVLWFHLHTDVRHRYYCNKVKYRHGISHSTVTDRFFWGGVKPNCNKTDHWIWCKTEP